MYAMFVMLCNVSNGNIRINLEWKAVMCNGVGEHRRMRRCKCESANVGEEEGPYRRKSMNKVQ